MTDRISEIEEREKAAFSRPNIYNEPLKPCPFCGCADIRGWTVLGTSSVYCLECGVGTCYESDVTKAIEAWNRRAGE